jgi:hypothetical protein
MRTIAGYIADGAIAFSKPNTGDGHFRSHCVGFFCSSGSTGEKSSPVIAIAF